MLITITPDELEEEFKESWRMGFISHPHIDYATNAIHATFENKDIIIFKFHKYGWISDNRKNTYSISAGSAGILIKII
jgi:hypothetical protein